MNGGIMFILSAVFGAFGLGILVYEMDGKAHSGMQEGLILGGLFVGLAIAFFIAGMFNQKRLHEESADSLP